MFYFIQRMMELFSATNRYYWWFWKSIILKNYFKTRTGLTREPRGLPHLIKMADKIPEMEDLAVGSFKTKNKRTGKNRRNKSKYFLLHFLFLNSHFNFAEQLRAGRLYIETALFLDAAAYQSYSKFYSGSGFSNPDIKIRDLVLRFLQLFLSIFYTHGGDLEVTAVLMKNETRLILFSSVWPISVKK